MNYTGELSLVKATLKKMKIDSYIVSAADLPETVFDKDILLLFSSSIQEDIAFCEQFPIPCAGCVYRIRLMERFSFIYCLLPEMPNQTLFLIGPFVREKIDEGGYLEILDMVGSGPEDNGKITETILSVPAVRDSDDLYFLLDTFFEKITENESYTFTDIQSDMSVQQPPIKSEEENPDKILLKLRDMERRYEMENRMMENIRLGRMNKINFYSRAFSELTVESRLSDPVRNMKNYGIILNTLGRKAAEEGGVHPMYLDGASSDYARELELARSADEVSALMYEMLEGYCRLVRNHSMSGFSDSVKQCIIYIDSNLSGALSLNVLADTLGMSAGYLAGLFKRETGKTLGDFIAEKRINLAIRLLTKTNLQIQTIAMHSGIPDVQYFCKFFRKHTGKAPGEYRKAAIT